MSKLSLRALLDAKPTEEDYEKFAGAVIEASAKKFDEHNFRMYKGTPEGYSLVQISLTPGDFTGTVSYSELVEMRAVYQLDQETINRHIAKRAVTEFPLGDGVKVLSHAVTVSNEVNPATGKMESKENVEGLTGTNDIVEGDLNFNLTFIDGVNEEVFKESTDSSVTYHFA